MKETLVYDEEKDAPYNSVQEGGKTGIRKSEFRNYVMISSHTADNIINFGNESPNAMKFFLYAIMNMDKSNTIKNFKAKDFQDAFNYGKSSITLASVRKYRKELISKGFIEYKEDSGDYIVNPEIAWSTYSSNKSKCRFSLKGKMLYIISQLSKHNKEIAVTYMCKLISAYNAHKDVQNVRNGLVDFLAKLIADDYDVQSYYTINKNYMGDLCWLSEQNNRALTVLFYLFSVSDKYNLVHVENANMTYMCEKLKVGRNAVSKAVNQLSQYNFIYIRKNGKNNEYIINPDLFWNAVSELKKKCEFPLNLSINTPAGRQHVSEEKEHEDYEELADIVMGYIHDNNMDHICGDTDALKVRFRRSLVSEITVLDNSCASSAIVKIIKNIGNAENSEK